MYSSDIYEKLNIIELKFGDMRKGYKFTSEFKSKYPFFVEEFGKFWMEEPSYFKNPYQILDYVEKHNIPVDFYFNFINRFARDNEQVREYLDNQGRYVRNSNIVISTPYDYGTRIEVKTAGL